MAGGIVKIMAAYVCVIFFISRQRLNSMAASEYMQRVAKSALFKGGGEEENNEDNNK